MSLSHWWSYIEEKECEENSGWSSSGHINKILKCCRVADWSRKCHVHEINAYLPCPSQREKTEAKVRVSCYMWGTGKKDRWVVTHFHPMMFSWVLCRHPWLMISKSRVGAILWVQFLIRICYVGFLKNVMCLFQGFQIPPTLFSNDLLDLLESQSLYCFFVGILDAPSGWGFCNST